VAKHALMRNVVGQEVGAVAGLNKKYGDVISRAVWFDQTAGDGVAADDTTWTTGCSPGILASHAKNLLIPARITMSEIQRATHDRLLAKLDEQLPELGYTRQDVGLWTAETVSGSLIELAVRNASGWDVDSSFVSKRDAVLVLNDPNAITEWAMRPTFAQELKDRAWASRSLSSMGCNPVGLKRTKRPERDEWFALVEREERALPPYRDLLLTAIERDDAQWAYLISQPCKWRSKTESVVRTAFNTVGRTVAMSWYRTDREAFEATKQTLFYTRQELREMGLA